MGKRNFRVMANFPNEIKECLDQRVRETLLESRSAYLVLLLISDILERRQHSAMPRLLRQPAWIQDQIISEIVSTFDDPEARPEGWLNRRIDELAKEVNHSRHD